MEEKTKKRKAVYNPAADKKWRENNKDHAKYLNYRSKARTFVRTKATLSDIKELEELIEIRKGELMMKKVYVYIQYPKKGSGDEFPERLDADNLKEAEQEAADIYRRLEKGDKKKYDYRVEEITEAEAQELGV